MILLAIAMAVASSAGRLGPGPHTLVVSLRGERIQREFKTGAECARARDAIQRKSTPPPPRPGLSYALPVSKAFCVPRSAWSSLATQTAK